MTKNFAAKAATRKLAAARGVNYTTALRGHGDPIPVAAFERQRRELVWMAKHRLTRHADASCLCDARYHHENSSPNSVYLQGTCCRFNEAIQPARDHVKVYAAEGDSNLHKRPVVITMAPYPVLDPEGAAAAIAAAAIEHGLRYRIGHLGDDTYGRGTIPIVMWNPDLIDLP